MTTLWVGGYTPGMSGTAVGIGQLDIQPDGSLVNYRTAAIIESPSYLVLDAAGHTTPASESGVAGAVPAGASAAGPAAVLATVPAAVLYAADEESGAISAFRVVDGELEPIGESAATADAYPCAFAVIHREHASAIVAASYGGGISVLPVLDDGSVLPFSQSLLASGRGPHEAQDGPHSHAVLELEDGTVLTTDLGTDRVYIHDVWVKDDDVVALIRTGEVVLPPGTGPRDLLLHPSGVVWVLGEHGLAIDILVRDAAGFTLATAAPLPGAVPGDQAAALAMSSDGRFAYAGVRGSNLVSVLAVHNDGARLEPVDFVDCGGVWPRHLTVVAGSAGDMMYVANQESGSVARFGIDGSGIPKFIESLDVPTPTFLLVAG